MSAVVTPWEVSASEGIDYVKVVEEFGCELLTNEQLARFEALTGAKPHYLLRRKKFFAHRDFNQLLAALEHKCPIYLYTGRGPSAESLHIGHMIPFILCKWLQDVTNAVLVVQLTVDEKYLFKQGLELEVAKQLCRENVKDILAFGFDLHRTFLFSNIDYLGTMYETVLQIQKRVTFNQVKGIFGFNESTNIGMVAFPAIQAAPAFPSAFPGLFGTGEHIKELCCLIPCAIDQDAYFRMTRDVAPRLHFKKPSLLLSAFLPALQGATSKMSSSVATTSVLVSDSPAVVKKKINKYAFSGGQATTEEQRAKGASLEVDVSYQYLTYFMADDARLREIGEQYASGQLLTGEVKAALIDTLNEHLRKHQALRAQLGEADIQRALTPQRPELMCEITAACEAHRAARARR